MAETPSASSPYPPSYYAASRNIIRTPKTLAGEVAADICVVGAGYSGLSAAISLAENGFKVVVVEGAEGQWLVPARLVRRQFVLGDRATGLADCLDEVPRELPALVVALIDLVRRPLPPILGDPIPLD